MSLFKKKNKDEETDLSVVDDYKEPFSWRNFWDDQVVGRIKKIKEFLQKNGVLFFLLSPFQYKNRLIMKIVLIFLGVMIGVVPRTTKMIDQAKTRNESSEIATSKPTSTGSISVVPLESSQYERTHLLAFNISGDTQNGVPSTTDGFDVTLSQSRGVTDAQAVKYRYKVLPVNQSNRILLVYVDNTKQNDKTGIFNLDVHMKDEEPMKTPIEVVLSDNQETTSLYNDKGIHLSALTNVVGSTNNSDSHVIKDAEDALDKSIEVYDVNEQRLNASGMTLGMTTSKLREFVDSQLILTNLKDDSTIEALKGDPKKLEPVTVTSTITYQDKTYSDSEVKTNESDESEDMQKANQARDVELPALSNMINDIQSNISALNMARMNKYNSLVKLESVLNQKVTPDDMSKTKTVK